MIVETEKILLEDSGCLAGQVEEDANEGVGDWQDIEDNPASLYFPVTIPYHILQRPFSWHPARSLHPASEWMA
jgi:hypothetical protein